MAGQTPTLSPEATRTLLLGTATRRSQIIPSQKYNSNGPMILVLPNAGIGEKVRIFVNGSITAAVAAASTGKRWPDSLFNRVALVDPLGVQRISAKPHLLKRLMRVKRYRPAVPFNLDALNFENATDVLGAAQLINNPLAGTSNALPIGTTNVAGFFDMPIAFSPVDLRGAFRLDVANGQTTIQLDPIPVLSSTTPTVDVPITTTGGGTVDVTNLLVQGVYYYFDPVVVNVPGIGAMIPYPVADMAMIHELVSTDDTSGLTAGTEKLYTLPTGREYYRLFQVFSNVNTTGFAQGLISRRRFLIDGNIPTKDETIQMYLADYLERYGYLPADTEIFYNFVDRPWDSNRYGQLQTSLFIASGATINAGAKIETLREALYISAQVGS